MADKFIVTKETLLSELIDKDENIEDVLVGFGLSCCSCPMHAFDTLQDAADIHGLDVDLIVQKCQEFFDKKSGEDSKNEDKKSK